MRKNIVAGNWKMNTTLQEGVALAKEIDAALAGVSTKCDVIIATPFTHLVSVVNAIDTKRIGVGAENCAVKIERKVLIQERFLPRWWHRRVLNMLFSVTPNVVHIITKLPKS